MKPSSKAPLVAAVAVVVAVVVATIIFRGRDMADPDAGVQHPADPAVTGPAAVPASPPPPRAVAADRPRRGMGAANEAHTERRREMREEYFAKTSAMRDRFAGRFASEQVDPAWAPQKEGELSTIAREPAFDKAQARPTKLDIGCRSSVCRIDGQFESRGSAEDWILMYMSSVGDAMPNSVVSRNRNPDGSIHVEIYGRAR